MCALGWYLRTEAGCRSIIVLTRSLIRKMSRPCRELTTDPSGATRAQMSGRETVANRHNAPHLHRRLLISSIFRFRCPETRDSFVAGIDWSEPVNFRWVSVSEKSLPLGNSMPKCAKSVSWDFEASKRVQGVGATETRTAPPRARETN